MRKLLGILGLVILAACSSQALTEPSLTKSANSNRSVEFTRQCNELTCTFTQVLYSTGPTYFRQVWYFYEVIPCNTGTCIRSLPNGSGLVGNPMTFTFPAPGTYQATLVAFQKSKGIIADSVFTLP